VRKTPYERSTEYSERFNGCPIHEPAALDDLDAKAEPAI
jgi:hypothetical protein